MPKYSESYLIYFELNDRTLRSGMNVFKLKGCSLLHHKLALTVLRLVTLLITVSGISAFNLGAPFWGLIGGVLVHEILTRKRK